VKGWVYEVAEDADYNAGSPDHDKPFYFLEIRIPINRLDLLAKQGLIRDFTRVVLKAEGSDNRPENARRVWVTTEPGSNCGKQALVGSLSCVAHRVGLCRWPVVERGI
jgi:hypothetical protein